MRILDQPATGGRAPARCHTVAWLALVLALTLAWAFAPDRLAPRSALAAQSAEAGHQQATPTPERAGDSAAPRRDMTGAVLALTLLCVLNAIGLGVMIGLSKRMQTVAEEALKRKRRGR